MINYATSNCKIIPSSNNGMVIIINIFLIGYLEIRIKISVNKKTRIEIIEKDNKTPGIRNKLRKK